MITPTSEQLRILLENADNYDKEDNEDLSKMLGISTFLVPEYRKYLSLYKGRRCYLKPLDVDIEHKIIEMKALIELCETTDSREIKAIAKKRLRKLSGIPVRNVYSVEYISRVLFG